MKLLLATIFFANVSLAQPGSVWEEGTTISSSGRTNPYEFSTDQLPAIIEKGRLHAVSYPVDITGVLIPYNALENFFATDDKNILRKLMNSFFRNVSRFKSMDQMYQWVGLSPYPRETESGVYKVPYPNGIRPNYRMGATILDTNYGKALTFSCAACHSTNLFGKTVLGLTNKMPRANEFFLVGKKAFGITPRNIFQFSTNATDAEMVLFDRAKENLRFIDSRAPAARGLDTSLAHTAISLAHRAPDAYATKDDFYATFPQKEPLKTYVADSKPMPWWNVKYKNRWLADGSVVSGNPIFTNILWNEIGRGSDLHEVEKWLHENPDKVAELTTAVFSSEAPRYTDFFGVDAISIERAKKGEQIFNQSCAKCHGSYKKGWDSLNPNSPKSELLKTVFVRYHERTPVIDVGTDSQRYLGMASLAPTLNRLQVSQNNGIVVKQQKGYVPPPLVGIWARWPYFHNNSSPNLCAVLTPANKRPKIFYVSEAIQQQTDFDSNCVGLPVGKNAPTNWKNEKWRTFDTRQPGLSNRGHDEGIFLDKGNEIYSAEQKLDLIEYLKTL